MTLKSLIKNTLGDKGFEQLSLLKTRMSVTSNRLWRSLTHPKGIHPAPKMGTYAVPDTHTFFGYYDITPFSGNDQRLLAMVTASADHDASAKHDIRVGYFNLEDRDQFVEVGQTATWCWQMGCRLQWYPKDPNRLIFYNTLVENQYGAVVQDINKKNIEKQFNWPIYAIDGDGNIGLSVNFSRLQRLRPGYGYRNLPDNHIAQTSPDNDGIWRIDLEDGSGDLIIDLSRLANFEPLPTMANAQHYVNHLEFNPSGNRFMFFHLWAVDGKRYNRLMTSDVNGKNLCVLEREGTSSHYAWKSETELLATVHYPKNGVRYNLYTDGIGLKNVVGKDLLTKDGHPSYSPEGDLLLSDSYPDKFREQHVLLLAKEDKLVDLKSFYSPLQFRGEIRCDLHPRWNRSGNRICVDTTKSGLRELVLIDLSESLP